MQSGWHNWRKISKALCDRRINVKVKERVYKTVVRPTGTYGTETASWKSAGETFERSRGENAQMDVWSNENG